MHVMTKVKLCIYAWYAVVALGIGAWAGLIFQTYGYDSYSNGNATYNWTAFAVGAWIAAVLTFPLPLFAMVLDRRRQEREDDRELDDARQTALHAKVDALLGANGLGTLASPNGAEFPDGAHSSDGEVAPVGDDSAGDYSVGDDLAELAEIAPVSVRAQARSPYEPPPER